MENAIPTVTLCHVLLNIIDGGTQYFATPNEIDTEGAIEVPENALWVSLGNTEENWIEIHPVEVDDPTLQEFLDDPDYYEIVLDDAYLPPWVVADTEDCRWFAELID